MPPRASQGDTLNNDRHHAITAAANLRTIATLYPDLVTALGTKEQPDDVGKLSARKPGSTIPINVKASEVKHEIDTWAFHLAQTLVDNIGWKLPNPATTPRILKDIADFRIGHFTENTNGEEFLDAAHHYAHLIDRTIQPLGIKRIRLGVPCHAPECDGQYEALLLPWKQTTPDMTCNVDEEHRLTPYEWNRYQRRPGNYQPQFVQQLARELFDKPART